MIKIPCLTDKQVNGNKNLHWLPATCPICHERFYHLYDYKPITCGQYHCLREASLRGLLK